MQVVWYKWPVKRLYNEMFGLVWFLCFNGISTFVGFFNAKAILLEEQ